MPETYPADQAATHGIRSEPSGGLTVGSLVVLTIGLLANFVLGSLFIVNPWTWRQFWHQDVWLLAAIILALGAAAVVPRRSGRACSLDWRAITALAGVVFVIAYLGHWFVLDGHDQSRDEQMATFDAWIFARGHLAWPVPRQWWGHVDALNSLFLALPANGHAWVSNYLPMNAALGALAELAGDMRATGPVLTALSLPLLWSCARCLWPEDREAPTVAVLLLAVSGQFLFAGMTAFAMPAHLLFNLLWLRLFLADRRTTDGLAIIIGFVATGLHQPLFHPMFVAPFLLLLLRERNWRRLALFVVAYAIIGVFWLSWPEILGALFAQPAQTGNVVSVTPAGSSFLDRLLGALSENTGHVVFTMENLLRFCTWQHMLLLPLLIAGCHGAFRDRMGQAIALGFLLPIVVMGVILPWQGNGFGYRYLHPALGNAALLGAYGWRSLSVWHFWLRGLFQRATAASVFLLLPLQAWFAHAQYAPFARADRQIQASKADYAIVTVDDVTIAQDVVLNRPDLSNRPIRLLTDQLGPYDAFARFLCRPGTRVALTTRQFLRPLLVGYDGVGTEYARQQIPKLRTALVKAGCQVSLL